MHRTETRMCFWLPGNYRSIHELAASMCFPGVSDLLFGSSKDEPDSASLARTRMAKLDVVALVGQRAGLCSFLHDGTEGGTRVLRSRAVQRSRSRLSTGIVLIKHQESLCHSKYSFLLLKEAKEGLIFTNISKKKIGTMTTYPLIPT